jgi:NADPH:quinone reductase-like Zn-dependent oxidoreductase
MHGFTITDLTVPELRHYAARLNELFENGVFRSRIAMIMRLEQSAEAHNLLESGSIDGKIVIKL